MHALFIQIYIDETKNSLSKLLIEFKYAQKSMHTLKYTRLNR